MYGTLFIASIAKKVAQAWEASMIPDPGWSFMLLPFKAQLSKTLLMKNCSTNRVPTTA
jgi:hypothetical protein